MFEEIVVRNLYWGIAEGIADSGDSIEEAHARQACTTSSTAQKELKIPVKITDADFEDVPEVDIKLLKLQRKLGGKVVTNDYNLNKVAAVQDVPGIQYQRAYKRRKADPDGGRRMRVTIVKDGKEANQELLIWTTER